MTHEASICGMWVVCTWTATACVLHTHVASRWAADGQAMQVVSSQQVPASVGETLQALSIHTSHVCVGQLAGCCRL